MKNKIVLITGAGGYVGRHLAEALAKDNFVVALDNNENNLRALSNRISCITEIGSIEDEEFIARVFEHYHPNVTVHCAALKHVQTGEEQPLETINVNIVGTLNIFSAADRYNCETCILVSTDKADKPINVYGKTKQVCEKLAQAYSKTSECRYLIIRFCNIYGSSGSVVEIFAERLKAHLPLTVTRGATRYFITIEQVIKDILTLYATGQTGKIYLTSNYTEKSIESVAYEVAKDLGFPPSDVDILYQTCSSSEKLKEDYSLDYGIYQLKN